MVHAIQSYADNSNWEIARWEHNFSRLSNSHQALLPNVAPKIAAARQAIHQNKLFLNAILDSLSGPDNPEASFVDAVTAAAAYSKKHDNVVSPIDVDKVNYVLKNVARDWSEEGCEERRQSYGRIEQELLSLFGANSGKAVLVPGAGLGRLVFDLALNGFETVGNEFSYYMLITSSYILNESSRSGQWTLFPWVLQTSNQVKDSDQLRSICIPDVHPASLEQQKSGQKGSMAMYAGDFVEIFAKEEFIGAFDGVATCFFIDTSHNVIQYMELMYAVLKPGGYWINVGPLLYHWAEELHASGDSDSFSIEISLSDIIRIASAIGFTILKNDLVPADYMNNKKSMLRPSYNCSFIVAQK